MTTMSYLLDDKNKLTTTATLAFNRRKQLCPFELSQDDLIDVMHSPMVAQRVRELISMRPKALHWDQQAVLLLPTGDARLATIRVNLNSRSSFPLPVDHRGPAELYGANGPAANVDCWTGPMLVRMLDWAWKAVQVELENRWAMRIVHKLVQATTTHQQVHRYMPELYSLLSHQQENTLPANAWGGRRIVDVQKALNEIGSKRATKVELHNVSVKDRANLKSLVAQALLMPVHDGLKPGSEFDNTWVELK